MPRNPREKARNALEDMLDSAKLAVEYLGDTDFDGLLADSKLQDAIVRRIEIIGEAAKRVDDSIRSEFTDMAWRDICGMRDILIHQYDDVDYNIVYATVKDDLPTIISEIETYFEQHPDGSHSDEPTP